MFGHHVAWNYNQQGDHHLTFPGGCISILVNLIIAIYAFLQVKQMVRNENDDNNSFEAKTDYLSMGPVNLKDGYHMPMYWFQNAKTKEYYDIAEVEKYLSVHFAQGVYRKKGASKQMKKKSVHYRLKNCDERLKEHDNETYEDFQ